MVNTENLQNEPELRTSAPDSDSASALPSETDALTRGVRLTLLPKRKQRRIWELDFMRGLCVALMIIDHLAMLLCIEFGPSWFGESMSGEGFGPALCRLCLEYYQNSELRRIGHPIVLFLFFSISGISCSFSRSNFKRGGVLLLIALLYSGVTYAIQEGMGVGFTFVAFGVLHFLAVCILIYALISALAKHRQSVILIISACIVITVLCLYFLYTPPEDTPMFFAIFFPPYDFYGNPSLFYVASDFSPGDLFTLIPYSAFFFFGVFITPLLYPRRRSLLPVLDRGWHKPLSFAGRHALILYILHVVLLALLLDVIGVLFVTPGQWVLF